MVNGKKRVYRQADDLYDLIGRMAAYLGTSRTTAVELAVYDLATRLEADAEGPAGLREALARRAGEIDHRRQMAPLEAMWEAKRALRGGWHAGADSERARNE